MVVVFCYLLKFCGTRQRRSRTSDFPIAVTRELNLEQFRFLLSREPKGRPAHRAPSIRPLLHPPLPLCHGLPSLSCGRPAPPPFPPPTAPPACDSVAFAHTKTKNAALDRSRRALHPRQVFARSSPPCSCARACGGPQRHTPPGPDLVPEPPAARAQPAEQGLLDNPRPVVALTATPPTADLAFDAAAPPPLLTFCDRDATSALDPRPDHAGARGARRYAPSLPARPLATPPPSAPPPRPPHAPSPPPPSPLPPPRAPTPPSSPRRPAAVPARRTPLRLDLARPLVAATARLAGAPSGVSGTFPPPDEGHRAGRRGGLVHVAVAGAPRCDSAPGMPATMAATHPRPRRVSRARRSAAHAGGAAAAAPAHLSSAAAADGGRRRRALPAGRRRGGGGAVGGGARRDVLALASLRREAPPRSRASVPEARGLGVGASAGARGGRRQRAARRRLRRSGGGGPPRDMPGARLPGGGDDVTMAHEAAARTPRWPAAAFPFNSMARWRAPRRHPARHHAQPSNPHSRAPDRAVAQRRPPQPRARRRANADGVPADGAPARSRGGAGAGAAPFGFGRGSAARDPGRLRSRRRRRHGRRRDGGRISRRSRRRGHNPAQ